MLRPEFNQDLLVSVLDRLIDQKPVIVAGAQVGHPNNQLSRLKEDVKRDLEWLLNTRQSDTERPDDLHHLDQSLLAYGVPDFTTFCLSNGHDRDRLRRSMEIAIGRFEPRLTGVVVTLSESRASDRT